MNFYFVVKFIDRDADYSVCAGQCIQFLHKYLAKRKINSIGICFPKWNNDSVGRCIAFVSDDKKLLNTFRMDKSLNLLSSNSILSISDILEVSDSDRKKSVRFVRNQGIGKFFSGDRVRRLKRRNKRAKDRGETLEYVDSNLSREFEKFHSIPVRSESTGQSFILFVQRKDVLSIPGKNEYSSYGLSTMEKFQGVVPEFKIS